MSAVAKTQLTEAQYLARERAANFRSEFLRGEVFAMAGASFAHNRIKENTGWELNRQLRGGPCFVLSSDQRVKVSATGLYTYPDLLVICGEPQFEDAVHDTLLNPRLICEVLSDSTEAYDRGAKFTHYRQIASLQEYLLIAQDRPLMERFHRQPEGSWLFSEAASLDAVLPLASVDARLALADIYLGVELPENPGR